MPSHTDKERAKNLSRKVSKVKRNSPKMPKKKAGKKKK